MTQGQDIVTYVCKKDPSQYRFLGYYGAKFWRYPKNREYGANVIDEFSQQVLHRPVQHYLCLIRYTMILVGLTLVLQQVTSLLTIYKNQRYDA